jgi:hypothetical protein
MDIRVVIDGMVRLIACGDKLPTRPSWPELREQVAECRIFTLEQLDEQKEYIIKKFYEFRVESMNQDMAKLLGNPIPANESSIKQMSSSQGSNNDSGFNESFKESESDEEGSFQPTVDKTANVSRSKTL